MKELSEILDEIAGSTAVQFVALVSRDGFIIENSSSPGEGMELAAARVAQLLFAAEEVGEELGNAGIKQIVVNYHNGLVLVVCLNSNTLLLAAVASEASVPWVQHNVRKYLSEINEKL